MLRDIAAREAVLAEQQAEAESTRQASERMRALTSLEEKDAAVKSAVRLLREAWRGYAGAVEHLDTLPAGEPKFLVYGDVWRLLKDELGATPKVLVRRLSILRDPHQYRTDGGLGAVGGGWFGHGDDWHVSTGWGGR